MAKNKPTAGKNENVQVAKINAVQAIIVALITATATAIPVYIAGQRHGRESAVTDLPSNLLDQSGNPINDNVIVIGSGTVYRYLNEHKILVGLSKNKHFNFLPLEGPTEVGAELFASASINNTVLVMASRKLDPTELSRPLPDDKLGSTQNKEHQPMRPEAVFEVYLGADPLQMCLVAGSEDNKTPPLKAYFEDILKVSSSKNKEEYLDFEKLLEIEKWWGEHGVYVGGERSATRRLWKTYLPKAWPPDGDLHFWDIIFPEDVNDPKEPRIYLGSKVLNSGLLKMLKSGIFSKKVLDMHSNSELASRGLYLYGVIDKSNRNREIFDGRSGYKLPNHVKEILKYVLDSIENSSNKSLKLITPDCIQKQRDYFNLNSDVGWVEADNNKRLFSIGDCARKPAK